MSVDRRDPQSLGTAILQMVAVRSDCQTAADAADMLARLGYPGVEDYDGGESMLTLTLQDRQTELETRAAEGDRFAAALLAGDSLAEEVVD